jgi:hypothetical protein
MKRQGYLRIGPPQLRTLPVPEYDQADGRHRALAERVRQLLAFRERRAAGQAQVLQEQIDELVYRIYSLTDAERLVVEQSPGLLRGRAGRPGRRSRA